MRNVRKAIAVVAVAATTLATASVASADLAYVVTDEGVIVEIDDPKYPPNGYSNEPGTVHIYDEPSLDGNDADENGVHVGTNPSPTPPTGYSTETTVKAKKLTLNRKSAATLMHGTIKLTATIAPSNATNKKLNWKSSNPKVASVSKNGTVTGIAKGKATVTASTTDGSNLSAKCVVQVKIRPVTSITLDGGATQATMKSGAKKLLKAKVNPANASIRTLSWRSTNAKVAKVSSNGTVTAGAPGTATITATAKDGSKKKATIRIVVK